MAEKIYLKDEIQEYIRQKYAPISKIGADNEIIKYMFNYISETHAKEIVEKFGPVFNPNFLIFQEELNEQAKHKFQFSSPMLLNDYIMSNGMKKVAKHAGLDWAIKELPYASKSLKRKFLKMKDKKIDLVVIGYGGAMSNLLWDLTILTLTFSELDPFNSIKLFEKDELSFTNLLRFGKPIAHKAFSQYELDDIVLPKFFVTDLEYHLAPDIEKIQDFLNKETAQKLMEELENPVFIGAPDFETRKFLQEINAPFFFIGHGDNEVSITHQPDIHFAVQETYGTIDIPVLLVNLWMATYKLIDILSEDNNYRVNDEIWKFNFDSLTSRQLKDVQKAFREINED